MMEKYGTKKSSPKVDGKRAAKENDSAQLIISIKKYPRIKFTFSKLKIMIKRKFYYKNNITG